MYITSSTSHVSIVRWKSAQTSISLSIGFINVRLSGWLMRLNHSFGDTLDSPEEVQNSSTHTKTAIERGFPNENFFGEGGLSLRLSGAILKTGRDPASTIDI